MNRRAVNDHIEFRRIENGETEIGETEIGERDFNFMEEARHQSAPARNPP